MSFAVSCQSAFFKSGLNFELKQDVKVQLLTMLSCSYFLSVQIFTNQNFKRTFIGIAKNFKFTLSHFAPIFIFLGLRGVVFCSQMGVLPDVDLLFHNFHVFWHDLCDTNFPVYYNVFNFLPSFYTSKFLLLFLVWTHHPRMKS